MNEENYEYRNTAKVFTDMQDIKNPVMFELTARQLAFIGMAVIAVVFTWLITCRLFEMNQTAVILLCLLFVCPFLAFGFISPSGMPLEEWLALWWSNNIKSSPIKKKQVNNAYELAFKKWELKTKDKNNSKKTRLPKGKVMNQKILDGKINAWFPEKKLFCYKGQFFRLYRINSIKSLTDLGLINGMYRGYRFEYIFRKGVSYLLIGLEKDSERYLDFLASELDISLLSSGLSQDALGISEVNDQICDCGLLNLTVGKKGKDGVYTAFTLSNSKQMKHCPGYLSSGSSQIKTFLLTGIDNAECSHFIDRVSEISESIVCSIHFLLYEPCSLKTAVYDDASIKPAGKKTSMLNFINRCISRNDPIFSECMFVRISGDKNEIAQISERLKTLCSSECIELNTLNSEQRQGYTATLPLLTNRVTFSRAISGMKLVKLMPAEGINYEQNA